MLFSHHQWLDGQRPAAHVDFPQHARVIEVADHSDRTLSLCREDTCNDLHSRKNPLGTVLDRNTELLVSVR